MNNFEKYPAEVADSRREISGNLQFLRGNYLNYINQANYNESF